MSTIKVQDMSFSYAGSERLILKDINMEVKAGEFVCILGQSGCGKSTFLRLLAGLEKPTEGKLLIDEKEIKGASLDKGVVFQDYGLFPWMKSGENIMLALRQRFPQRDKKELKEIAMEMLEAVGLDSSVYNKFPKELSGGMKQRCAIAQAFSIDPPILLMDEPLCNLDAKLRVEMRTVIKEIQNSVGITTVYVTHDQEEAMAVSDRIAVMNHGDIQQIGTPKVLYQRPANLFVATFIGHTNVLDGKLVVKDGKAYLQLANGYEVLMNTIEDSEIKEQDVKASIRPEELVVNKDNQEGLKAIVDDAVFLGLNTHYFAHLVDGEKIEIIQESQIDSMIEKGTEISLSVKTEKINIFDNEGNHNLVKGVVNDYDIYKD